MRFPGFYNEWKKICIESLITEEKIYTSDFEKYPLHSFTIELGIIPKTERYERGFLIKKDGNLFKVVQQNDFVMNPMNLRFGAINYSKVSKSISVSGYYNIFRIDNCKFNDFWNAYFKTPKILNLYNSIATGSLVEKKRVHFSQFKKIKMYMPCELEKQKIDTLIKLLDLRIETQSKIISDYKLLKNHIIKKVFHNCSEYDSLESLIKFGKAGGTPKSTVKEFYDGNIPFLGISDITNQGKYICHTMKNITQKGLNNSSAWIVPKNSLILSMYASVGLPAINKIPLATSQAMMSMVFYDPQDVEYVYYYLRYFKKYRIHSLLETGTQSNINASTVKSIKIPKLKATEKEKYINLFTKFDQLIDREKQILSFYQKQKSFLLKNMFI